MMFLIKHLTYVTYDMYSRMCSKLQNRNRKSKLIFCAFASPVLKIDIMFRENSVISSFLIRRRWPLATFSLGIVDQVEEAYRVSTTTSCFQRITVSLSKLSIAPNSSAELENYQALRSRGSAWERRMEQEQHIPYKISVVRTCALPDDVSMKRLKPPWKIFLK
jgi:hypothetical protein